MPYRRYKISPLAIPDLQPRVPALSGESPWPLTATRVYHSWMPEREGPLHAEDGRGPRLEAKIPAELEHFGTRKTLENL